MNAPRKRNGDDHRANDSVCPGYERESRSLRLHGDAQDRDTDGDHEERRDDPQPFRAREHRESEDEHGSSDGSVCPPTTPTRPVPRS